MDHKWALPLLPTQVFAESEQIRDVFLEIFTEFKSPPNQNSMTEQTRRLTTALTHGQCYCPSTWLSRAYNLLRLGFPDLAIGDAYKATLLLTAYTDRADPLQSDVERQIRKNIKHNDRLTLCQPGFPKEWPVRMREYTDNCRARAAMILGQALFVANCFVECYEFLKDHKSSKSNFSDKLERLKRLAEQAQLTEDTSRHEEGDYVSDTDKDAQEARNSGSISSQTYPWSNPFLHRDDKVLANVRDNLYKASEGRCSIEISDTVKTSVTASLAEKQSLNMGIKVSTDIPTNSVIFVDQTFLSGVDNSQRRCCCCRGALPSDITEHELPCCEVHFCSSKCKETAGQYHHSVCQKPQSLGEMPELTFNYTFVTPDTMAANDLLYRLLAHLENNPAVHPLRTSTVGSMIPAYKDNSAIRFSFTNDIKRPFALLKTLGNDIFADHGYDTWVLQTIQARLRNNIRAFEDDHGQYHIAVNLLYMFFNHSCDPNITVSTQGSGGSSVIAQANRPILAGEELFISYLSNADLELPYAERQMRLKDWTGGECQCSKCQAERAQGLRNQVERRQTSPVSLVDSDEDNHVQYWEVNKGNQSLHEMTLRRGYSIEKTTNNRPLTQNLPQSKRLWATHVQSLDDYEDDDDYVDDRKKRRKA